MSQRTSNEFISLWLIKFSRNCLFDSDYGFMAFLLPPYTIELWHYFAVCCICSHLPLDWASTHTHASMPHAPMLHTTQKLAKRKNLHTWLPLGVHSVHGNTYSAFFVHVYLFTRYSADAKLFISIQRDKLAATAHCRLANFTCLQITILLFYAKIASRIQFAIRNAAVGGANHQKYRGTRTDENKH